MKTITKIAALIVGIATTFNSLAYQASDVRNAQSLKSLAAQVLHYQLRVALVDEEQSSKENERLNYLMKEYEITLKQLAQSDAPIADIETKWHSIKKHKVPDLGLESHIENVLDIIYQADALSRKINQQVPERSDSFHVNAEPSVLAHMIGSFSLASYIQPKMQWYKDELAHSLSAYSNYHELNVDIKTKLTSEFALSDLLEVSQQLLTNPALKQYKSDRLARS